MRKRQAKSYVSVVMAVLVVVSQGYAVTGGPQLPNPGSAPLTHDQQIQLGYQAASQVYQQMPVLPENDPLTLYVQQLGKKLAATIPSQYSWPWEFHVIPQKDINAFALPGGPMFVNAGTIAAASNEAELAGVMAHEMSHVYMQHGAKQVGKSQTTSLIAGIAGAVLGAATHGVLGQLAQAGIQFGAQGIMLKYSREDEAQADYVGAIIMWKAGYNPKAMAEFFQKLATEGGSAPPQFLSDHPNPGNREQAIKDEIASWPQKRYKNTSAAFQQAHQRAVGTKLYTAQQIEQGAKSGEWTRLNRQSGAVFKAPEGVAVTQPASAQQGASTPAAAVPLQDVLPSPHMVTSDLGPITISHPDNWQVAAPTQSGEDVRVAPPAGVSGNAIGYGVVINGAKPKNGQSMDLDQMTAELVQALQSGGDVQPAGNPKTISVAGTQGRSVEMTSTSPFRDANGQPQKEADWLVTVPRPDGSSVIYLVFVAPQAEVGRFRPSFEKMLQSLQFNQ